MIKSDKVENSQFMKFLNRCKIDENVDTINSFFDKSKNKIKKSKFNIINLRDVKFQQHSSR